MVTVSGVRGGRWRAGEGLDDVPGDVDVTRGVGDPDAGDGFAGGLGEVGKPVRAGGG